jgi:hypothetical protein
LVLRNNTDGLETSFVVVDSMSESHVEARKIFDSSVERLLAGSSPTLKMPNIRRVVGVWSTNDVLLADVALVSNYLFSGRNLGHELVTEDPHIMDRCFVWAIHPYKTIIKHGEGKLIIHTSLARLVRVVLGVLTKRGVSGLIHMAMHPVHRDDVNRIIIII